MDTRTFEYYLCNVASHHKIDKTGKSYCKYKEKQKKHKSVMHDIFMTQRSMHIPKKRLRTRKKNDILHENIIKGCGHFLPLLLSITEDNGLIVF